MWEEAYEHIRSEEENHDREQRESQHYDHDDNVETTYERAQYNEDIEQEIYERDDKMGAI